MIYFDIILNQKLNLYHIFKLYKKLKLTFLKDVFKKEIYLGNENIKIFYRNKYLIIKCKEGQERIILKELNEIKKLDKSLLKIRKNKEQFKDIIKKYKLILI